MFVREIQSSLKHPLSECESPVPLQVHQAAQWVTGVSHHLHPAADSTVGRHRPATGFQG